MNVRIRSTPRKKIPSSSKVAKPQETVSERSSVGWILIILVLLTFSSYWLLWNHHSISIPYLRGRNDMKLSFPRYFGDPDYEGNSNIASESIVNIDVVESDVPYYGNIVGSLMSASNQNVRNLVLGLAANTDSKYFAIFCGSLRAVSSTVEVVIFINAPIPERHREISTRYSIVLIEYDTSLLEPSDLRVYHPSTLRWILFSWLLNHDNSQFQNLYDRVLFADVRDTFFQSDPFVLMPANKSVFYAFAENSGQTIGACGWNSKWISDCFGQNMLDLVNSMPIICSGISLATMDRAAEYLDLMTSIMTGESLMGRGFPKCERNGVDQGVHNVLIHMGLLTSQEIMYEMSFPITHMQTTQLGIVLDPINAPSTVYIADKLASVVHQYDRFGGVQQHLARKYVYWINFNDEMSSWNDEVKCKPYTHVKGRDMFAGMCDFGSLRAISPSSCCEACDNKIEESSGRKCDAFAFSEGVCYFKSCTKEEIRLRASAPANFAVLPESMMGLPPVADLMSAYRLD